MQRIIVSVKHRDQSPEHEFEVPSDLAAGRLAALLAAALAWDHDSGEGRIVYQIEVRPQGRLLPENESLAAAGVWDGAGLVLHPRGRQAIPEEPPPGAWAVAVRSAAAPADAARPDTDRLPALAADVADAADGFVVQEIGDLDWTPPLFQRAPRLHPTLPTGEVEIPAPSALPQAPQLSLFTILLPMVFSIIALIGTLLATPDHTLPVAILLSFGFMGIGSITGFLSYYTQRTIYRQTVQERERRYQTMLDQRRKELDRARQAQGTALNALDPSPAACVLRAESQDRQLWERAPRDADFLRLRVGLGALPCSVTVKAPRQDLLLDDDPLYEEARRLADEFAQVKEVPIGVHLREAGVAGLVGPQVMVLETARALMMQLATQHSPDEVKIVALFSHDDAFHWRWCRWLPHVWSEDRTQRYLADDKQAAHKLLIRLYDELHHRRLHLGRAGGPAGPPGPLNSQPPLPWYVFFIADPRLVENEPLMHLLLTEGPALGAAAVFCREPLPQACQVIIDLRPNNLLLIHTTATQAPLAFKPDPADVHLAERLARALTPVRLQRHALPTEIPRMVSLLDLFGTSSVEGLDVAGRWRRSDPEHTLEAPIGRRAGGETVMLDLHETRHGPNGLVAGTVGSGKSELLQTLVAALAINFPPHELAFALLDFKGGGMSDALRDLPHVVNTITDLELDYVPRALLSLEAEVERRERLFQKYKRSLNLNNLAIEDYIRLSRADLIAPRDRLPYLILIVDEFTVLKDKRPDDMRRFVTVAVKGRALGFRMILATQKPGGVVSDQIDANTKFRLCLRVARPEDSQEMIKRRDAADLPSDSTGRAYFRVGNDDVFELFQTAWSGAPYAPTGQAAPRNDAVQVVELDGTRRAAAPVSRPVPAGHDPQVSGRQLAQVVKHLRDVAHQAEQEPGSPSRHYRVWLDPLPEIIVLGREGLHQSVGWNGQTWRPSPTWLQPVVGLVDKPHGPAQGPLTLNLADGHLVVYGKPGSGKTTFAQTLITALAQAHTPQEVNFYLLDFGGQALQDFGSLPHVGEVITAYQAERLQRLLRDLLREIDSRSRAFAEKGVRKLMDYRRALIAAGTTTPLPPAIVVVLDNYLAFFNTYPDAEDLLAQIAREGGARGIHLVLTANTPAQIRTKISSNITHAVALELADRADYAQVVGRTGGLEPVPVPGRGLLKDKRPVEFQTALPAAAETEAERTAELRHLIEQMAAAWTGPRAPQVRLLKEIEPLCELLPPSENWPAPLDGNRLAAPLGRQVEDLESLWCDLYEGPHFLITGPPRRGKTILLQTWLLALAHQFPQDQVQLYLVDFQGHSLRPLQHIPGARYIPDNETLADTLAEIAQLIRERAQARRAADGMHDERAFLANYPALVLAMDDYHLLSKQMQDGTKERLRTLIHDGSELGLYILLAGRAGDLNAGGNFGPDSWLKPLRDGQTGVVLGSTESEDFRPLSSTIRLPPGEIGKPVPVGQGYYVKQGQVRKLKVATPHAGAVQLKEWVARIATRSGQPLDTLPAAPVPTAPESVLRLAAEELV